MESREMWLGDMDDDNYLRCYNGIRFKQDSKVDAGV